MLAELRKSARSIDLIAILDECILESKQSLFDLVRSQLAKGQSSVDYLPLYKNQKYALMKQQRGSIAPYGITDLKLTGKFQDRFTLRFSKYSFIIRSTDKKNSILLAKYGPEIFALNDDNLSYYVNEIIHPLMSKKIKNVLFK